MKPVNQTAFSVPCGTWYIISERAMLMKPVNQTTFGVPGGNCFSACVASILHLSIDEVPYFMGHDPLGRDWIPKLGIWLKERGMYPLILNATTFVPGVHIALGKSPRGVGNHAVVAEKDVLLHDPHPSRAGIVDMREKVVFIPYEPEGIVP